MTRARRIKVNERGPGRSLAFILHAESAKLSFLLRGHAVNLLNSDQLAELESLSLKS